MNPGSVFFDQEFAFHDGESGEKLFVVLGTVGGVSVAAKTTSQPAGKGNSPGCQAADRFHNYHLPLKSCDLKKQTWVCLDEFYELDSNEMLRKAFRNTISSICTLEAHIRQIQDCALASEDITESQVDIISSCLA